jgi:hypothetical protein
MHPLLEKFSLQFVKFNVGPVNSVPDRRKEANREKENPEDKENPTNIGPGITESHEELHQ